MKNWIRICWLLRMTKTEKQSVTTVSIIQNSKTRKHSKCYPCLFCSPNLSNEILLRSWIENGIINNISFCHWRQLIAVNWSKERDIFWYRQRFYDEFLWICKTVPKNANHDIVELVLRFWHWLKQIEILKWIVFRQHAWHWVGASIIINVNNIQFIV